MDSHKTIDSKTKLRNLSVDRRQKSVNASLAAHRRSKSAPRKVEFGNTKLENKNSFDFVQQFVFKMAGETENRESKKQQLISQQQNTQKNSNVNKIGGKESIITTEDSCEYRVKNNKYIARVEKPITIPLAALQMVGQKQVSGANRCQLWNCSPPTPPRTNKFSVNEFNQKIRMREKRPSMIKKIKSGLRSNRKFKKYVSIFKLVSQIRWHVKNGQLCHCFLCSF